MKFDLTKSFTVEGEVFEPEDLYQRKLVIEGVQPTDYENYVYLDLIVLHKNTKTTVNGDKAGGKAPALYRYDELGDIHKFNQHQYPFAVDVLMTDVTDKKGDKKPLILQVDFDSIQEMQLVPRAKAPTVSTAAKV